MFGVPDENMPLEQLNKQKLAKYGHGKRRSEGLFMAVMEGRLEGKCLPSTRRTACIDDVRRWTVGGLPAARRIALDRLWRMRKETLYIVVICLRPYKDYALPREHTTKTQFYVRISSAVDGNLKRPMIGRSGLVKTGCSQSMSCSVNSSVKKATRENCLLNRVSMAHCKLSRAFRE